MARLTKGLRRPSSTAAPAPAPRHKATGRPTGGRALAQAADDQCFWVNNGPVLKNIADLYYALKEMGDEQFDYHTKRDSNDFALWIDGALGESALANKLTKIRTRKGAIATLQEFLK